MTKEEANPPLILVINGNCLTITEQLATEGLNPMCLNLASEFAPGGGWLKGAMAQEESIFYRSTYCVSLKREFYPILENENHLFTSCKDL